MFFTNAAATIDSLERIPPPSPVPSLLRFGHPGVWIFPFPFFSFGCMDLGLFTVHVRCLKRIMFCLYFQFLWLLRKFISPQSSSPCSWFGSPLMPVVNNQKECDRAKYNLLSVFVCGPWRRFVSLFCPPLTVWLFNFSASAPTYRPSSPP